MLWIIIIESEILINFSINPKFPLEKVYKLKTKTRVIKPNKY